MTWRPFGGRPARPRIYPVPVVAPPPPPESAPAETDASGTLTVEWLVNRCPGCRGRDFRTRKTKRAGDSVVRKHVCRACGTRWRSVDKKK